MTGHAQSDESIELALNASGAPKAQLPDRSSRTDGIRVAAETKAGGTQDAKTPAKTPVSQKSAGKSPDGATAIDIGEVVKGRLGESSKTSTYHFWKVSLPAGRYRAVLDARRSDDKSSNIATNVLLFTAEDGEGKRLIGTNENDFRTRAAAWIDSTGKDIILRVDNDYNIIDYWLGVFPERAKITAPYFTRTPAITPVEFGKALTGLAEPKPGDPGAVWYSATLKAQDYKITAEFKRVDGKKSNIAGEIEAFGPIGEQVEGMNSRLCSTNTIDIAATCTAKLVLAEDTQMLFRINPGDSAYNTTFKIEPIETD
jgi:hypothetical protein